MSSWFLNLLSALGVLGSVVWVAFAVSAARHRKGIRHLAALSDAEPEEGWPSLAVVFAARDEAGQVEAAARSMLRLDYPGLRVIAVEDRSADGTGAILDRIAAEDARLTVVHVATLPDGWLGKTHALQAGADASDAEWILFTDADVIFAPGSLRRALAFAVRERADHVTVPPNVPTEGLGERLFLAMFQAALAMHGPGWRVEDDRGRASMGIGAFNLVRSESLRGIGGFRRLALSVDDDMQLGRALKWSGRRSRVVLGGSEVSVRWQVGLGGMVRGLEKNFFAAARFRVVAVVLATMVIYVLGAAPFAGLFVGPIWSRVICAVGVATIAVAAGRLGVQSGVKWYHGLLLPVGAAFCMVALWRSTALTLVRGGVNWRGHLYPLDQLRDHVRRREAWMAELWRSTR
jgi:hypothetical protein